MIGDSAASQSLRTLQRAGCDRSPAQNAFWRKAARALAAHTGHQDKKALKCLKFMKMAAGWRPVPTRRPLSGVAARAPGPSPPSEDHAHGSTETAAERCISELPRVPMNKILGTHRFKIH